MQNVYVVTSGQYSDYRIEAVFSNEGFAQQFVDIFERECYHKSNVDIEEWEVDCPKERWLAFTVTMCKDGTVYDDDITRSVDINQREGFARFYDDKLQWRVCADDAKHAIKIVNEKRSQILALDIWGDERAVRARWGQVLS